MSDTQKHIVVVDDEKDLAGILKESFEMEGYRVYEFHSAEEALEKIEAIPFDAILSDAHMPGMNGMDFLKELKERLPKDFLFFLCTGDLEITEKQLKDAGGAALISKPYNLFDVIDFVAKFL